MPIAKVTQGRSAYGCLNYVLTKEKAELLETNCATESPSELAEEFEVALQPHQRNGSRKHVTSYVAHFSIAFHKELERPQLEAIAHRFMDLMGFDPVMNQYVLAKHNDTDDCHLHLIENRVRLDGILVSDSFQKRRAEVAMRTIEGEFDLPRLKNSWEVDVRAPSVAEVRQSRQSGQPIPRRVVQESIEHSVVGTRTLAELQQRLQQSGVTLTATPRDDGNWALLYQLALEDSKVRTFSATKLGKRYTQRGLQSTFGVSFGEDEVTTPTVEAETHIPTVPLAALPTDVTPELPPTEATDVGVDYSVTESGAAETPTEPTFAVVAAALDQPVDHSVMRSMALGTVEMDSVTELIESESTPVIEAKHSVTESTLVPEVPTTTVVSAVNLDLPPVPIADTEPTERQADSTLISWSAGMSDQVKAESLTAVLQWTQNHIETLEQRAVWLGLQNASDQTRWSILSAQAQQRGLTDVQQIEYAVTALACQQGYETKAIVGLLQQSPRVLQALQLHPWRTVKMTLTQNVVQIRQALAKRQQETRRAQTRKAQAGK